MGGWGKISFCFLPKKFEQKAMAGEGKIRDLLDWLVLIMDGCCCLSPRILVCLLISFTRELLYSFIAP